MSYSDNRSKLFGCLALAASGIGLFLVLMLMINLGPYTSAIPRPFNSERWKEVSRWDDDVRCGMLADLRTRVRIEGKSRKELFDLLGPDENEIGDRTKSHWHLCPSFMDIYILEVRWEDDRVAEAWVRDT